MNKIASIHQVQDLLKQIIQAGKGFKDYNFRNYIVRRANEDLAKYSQLNNPEKLNEIFQETQKYLEVVKRQQIV